MNKYAIILIAIWVFTICWALSSIFIEDPNKLPDPMAYIDSLETTNDSLRSLTAGFKAEIKTYKDSLSDLKIKLQYFKGRQDYYAQENENIIRMAKYVKSLKDGTWVDQSKEEARADALLKDLVIFDSK